MILPPYPIRHVKRMILIHQITFVVTLAIPTYVAGMRASARLGIALAWYHHAALAVAGLLFGFAIMFAGGLTLSLVAILARSVVGFYRRLSR